MIAPVDPHGFVGAFAVEAEELVATASSCLLEIEVANDAGTSTPRAVRDLFCALHTIKGLASMIDVEPIVEVAHALETLVRAADGAGGTLGREAVALALEAVSAISERVQAVADRQVVRPAPSALLEAVAEHASAEAPVGEVGEEVAIPRAWALRLSPSERQQLVLALRRGAPVWTLSFTPSETNIARGITISTVRAGLGAIGEVIKVIPRTTAATGGAKAGVKFDLLLASDAPQAAIAVLAALAPERVIRIVPAEVVPAYGPIRPAPPVPGAPAAVGPGTVVGQGELGSTESRAVVRVELSRLDELQDQMSLLIVSRFQLEREVASLAERGHDVRRLREIARVSGRQLGDLRRAILRARMVRVAEVLEPLPLLARSLGRAGERVVLLELDTGEVELDKAVADRLLPALIHLVRNAVDHAIEPSGHRAAARQAGRRHRAGDVPRARRERDRDRRPG